MLKLISVQKQINSYFKVLNSKFNLNGENIEDVNLNPVLCHGGLNLENVVEHSSGKLYVLNWESAFEANKTVDFALTYYDLLYSSNQTAEIYYEEYIKANCERKENLVKIMQHVLIRFLNNKNKIVCGRRRGDSFLE